MLRLVFRAFIRLIDAVETALDDFRVHRFYRRNLHNVLWERAISQSADFVESKLHAALLFRDKKQVWVYAADQVNSAFPKGVALEFGVADGTSINFLSARMPSLQFHGFDSFIGLAEDWFGHHGAKGALSQGGRQPKVNANVSLVAGWFDQTLPSFVAGQDLSNLAFMHVDCDTYPATSTVFDVLGPHLKPGMLILFDELIGYPNWQNGEFKALNEASEKFGIRFDYIAFSTEQALIRIK